MKTHSYLREALQGSLWFIHEPKMREILAFLELRLAGAAADPESLTRIRAANEIAAARSQKVSASSSGSVVVLPLYGVVMHRASMMDDLSGPQGTSTERFLQQLRQAANDDGVRAIVIDVDSPGGSVDGVDELATEIYNARKKKQIVAVSNCLCASAAYYLAAQASEVVVSPSSLTGSIGVYMMHEDDSRMLDNLGVKITLIQYGASKTEGNSVEPLSDEARAHLQEIVDSFGLAFEKAVARGRGVKLDEVQKKFGQGRVFNAQQAVKLGLADRVGTLDDVLQKYGVTRGAGNASASIHNGVTASSASADDPETVTDDEGDECACACSPCRGGDCSACACTACACAGCACDGAASARKRAHASMRRRIDLTAA